MTDQEALLELGHIRETQDYFYYRFMGVGGLEPRALASTSGQMVSRAGLAAPVPAYPRCVPVTQAAWGSAHMGWVLRTGCCIGPQDLLKVWTETQTSQAPLPVMPSP